MINNDNVDKVKSLLKQIFRTKNANLDFGIYKIMNYKRQEIDTFIESRLIDVIQQEFKEFATIELKDIALELDKQKLEINSYLPETIDDDWAVLKNYDSPKVKEFLDFRKRYNLFEFSEVQINDVLSHVLTFFSRYYVDGDLIPQTRYGDGDKYYVPYQGEEVYFYWATKDMYYVKSGEYFNKYIFSAGNLKVTFKLVDAQIELGNIKGGKKYFVIDEPDPISIDEIEKNIFIRFNYRALTTEEQGVFGSRNIQEKLIDDAQNKIKAELSIPKFSSLFRIKEGSKKCLLKNHLEAYVHKNTKDFFIHKNIKDFFSKELDFYLKNKVLDFEILENSSETQIKTIMAKIKTIKNISTLIIEFMTQIEEFQKQLFEKKKFVLNTNFCITMDLVPESLYAEILTNEEQVLEWKNVLNLDEISSGAIYDTSEKTTLDVAILQQYPYLPIDTKYFSEEFKNNLLNSLENIDSMVKGVLIHSENYHSLNLISASYRESINCVYIDPPYNTGRNNFIYKDNYQHSTWLSMIYDRILLSYELLNKDGVIFISIDDREIENLVLICNDIFGSNNMLAKFKIKVRHEERILRGDKDYQEVMEYLLAYKKTDHYNVNKIEKQTNDDHYIYKIIELTNEPIIDNIGDFEVHIFKPEDYALTKIAPSEDNLKRYSIRGSLIDMAGSASEFYELYLRERRKSDGLGTLYKVINMGVRGDGLGYRYIKQPDSEKIKNGIYFQGMPLKKQDKKYIPYPTYYDFVNEFNRVNLESDTPFDDGKKPIKFIQHILKLYGIKNNNVILDYFAGSGSSGDAIIKYSKTNNINLYYIMTEMGEYFDSVLINRMKKVIFSNEWKNGIPQEINFTSHMFKYHSIEQYEDTLNNIEFVQSDGLLQSRLNRLPDYFITYMLDYETRNSPTRLSFSKFINPFDYKIMTINEGEEKEVKIDLVETFNYLLGLRVDRYRFYKSSEINYRVVYGTIGSEKAVVIWRDIDQLNLVQDKEYVENSILSGITPDKIYVNGDSYLPNAIQIEPEFKRLMEG
jgi:adenine-specific DNA-methyltransferase